MSEKLLIVDDEESILKLMRRAFEKAEFEVHTASNGVEALKVLRQQAIKVMIMDLQMPEMNGLELCKTIRESNPVAYLIAMTGYTSLFELTDCREAGFDDYYTKPLDIKELIQNVRDAFGKLDRWTNKRASP